MVRVIFYVFLFFGLLVGPFSSAPNWIYSASAKPLQGLVPADWAVAVSVVDGDTLVLDDGRQVRLVGVQAPKLPLGRKNFKTWPLATASKQALERLALGKRLRLSYGGRRIDRYNRALAHLHNADGLWIQAALLREGMARVYSFSDNRAVVSALLAAERVARLGGHGIRAHPFYAIRTPDSIQRYIGGFQLVEGRVLKVATVRKMTYLNFGDNWRDDFTITINSRSRRLFKKIGLDPKSLEGKIVRVRGWVKSRNGPMITATHPEQIEVLPN
ncbi:MAG: thermonuclease family protein [Alphaproteobacteria bacterium]|nr:thermonuclease family protein [Alphaproteobacteria bacterium]